MLKYPISFFGNASATPGMETNWSTFASNHEMTCAVPAEFEGAGQGLSPEDFYLSALQNCFLATFKVYAKYSNLNFTRIEAKCELIVDLDDSKKPCMKKILMHITLHQSSDLKKAQLLVKKALDNGFILQSVKTEIVPEITYL